jgi:hypothetical protein
MKFRGPNLLEFIVAGLILFIWLLAVRMGVFEEAELAGGRSYYKPLIAKFHNGIIISKYLDTKNHNCQTIEFNMNDSSECYLILDGECENALFRFIQVNDSLIFLGVDKVMVKRASIDSLFCLDE